MTLSSEHGVPLPPVALPQVTALDLDGVLAGETVADLAGAFPGLTSLNLRLICLSYQSAVDLSPLRAVQRAQVHVTLMGAGRVHGLDALSAERFSVRHEGRDRPQGRVRPGFLRRRRA
ncbi:hypothetical protein [Streptomyces sp. ALI-76-A]|uniref:hypothetical protein n=1 Tax=Streptomyces sp. ALI-76-A TaxID=3025736 RepID=UPI00256F2363|nr:hypothetical protein [Streptomyces sp. ALI-76-A]MDL5204845.1 hypothetical protein [Streptomyces sp. ALI-76-A]